MVVDFLSNPEIEEYALSSLMPVGGGGAPLPVAVGEKLEELTGSRYMEGYGLSETISQTHFNPPDKPKLQRLGVPSSTSTRAWSIPRRSKRSALERRVRSSRVTLR